MGLTLDEFALWLNLEDVYWSEKGRQSIDAVVVAVVPARHQPARAAVLDRRLRGGAGAARRGRRAPRRRRDGVRARADPGGGRVPGRWCASSRASVHDRQRSACSCRSWRWWARCARPSPGSPLGAAPGAPLRHLGHGHARAACSRAAPRRPRAPSRARTRWRWPSASSAPSAAGRPSQRAASTRSTWPWANSATRPCDRAQLGEHARPPARPPRSRPSPPGQPSRHRTQSGRSLADLRSGQALVLAVVPLEQLVAQLGRILEPGEAAGLGGAAERAGEHALELPSRRATRASSSAWRRPSLGQRHVGAPGVLAGPAPLGLAVAREHELARALLAGRSIRADRRAGEEEEPDLERGEREDHAAHEDPLAARELAAARPSYFGRSPRMLRSHGACWRTVGSPPVRSS